MISGQETASSSLRRREAAAFTLIELLITILVIALLAGMMLVMFYRAQESARSQRTRALVTKLDTIVRGKWEAYKTRRVPVEIPPGTPPQAAARLRLDGLRDLMRWELPERYTDLVQVTPNPPHPPAVNPAAPAVIAPVANWPYSSQPIKPPALASAYVRRIQAAANAGSEPSLEHQGAEMLYLIVMAGVADADDSRDVFKTDGAGDTDGDGMQEFLDGWGRPIQFLRWAPGFLSDLNIIGMGHGGIFNPSPPVPRTRYVDAPQVTATDYLPGKSYSTSPGSYVGGVLAFMPSSAERFDAGVGGMARITGYVYEEPGLPANTRRFKFTTPAYTGQLPFGMARIYLDTDFIVLAPDPFDPSGVYPLYPAGRPEFSMGEVDTSVASFAICPLIYSAGANGCYGIRDDGGYGAIDYRKNFLYPFWMAGGPLIGTPEVDGYEEFQVPGGWRDNIHNHMLQAAK